MTTAEPPDARIVPESERHDLVRLARGGLLNVVGGAFAAAAGFAFTVVLSRQLGPGQSGVFFTLLAATSIANVVVQLGAPTGLVRMLARARALGYAADIRPLIVVGLGPVAVLGTLVAIVVYVFAQPLAAALTSGQYADAATTELQLLAVWLLADAVLSTAARACQGLGRLAPLVVVASVAVPAGRLVLLAMIGARTAMAVGVIWTLPSIAGCLAGLVWLAAIERRMVVPRDAGWSKHVREFWSFTGYQSVASVIQIALLWLDVVLVGAMRSSHEAGVYNAASRYLSAGSLVLTSVVFVIAPQISAVMARHQYGRARAIYQTATVWLVALSFPIYLTLAVFASTFMSLFGADFSAGATPLTILSIAMLANMATGAVKAVLLMGGRSRMVLADNVVALVANVVLNIALIPRYGMSGAAVAWAISILLNNLVPAVQVWRAWNLQPVVDGSIVAAAAAIVCYGGIGTVARIAAGDAPLVLLASSTLATGAYIGVLWRFRRSLRAGVLREAFGLGRAARVDPGADVA